MQPWHLWSIWCMLYAVRQRKTTATDIEKTTKQTWMHWQTSKLHKTCTRTPGLGSSAAISRDRKTTGRCLPVTLRSARFIIRLYGFRLLLYNLFPHAQQYFIVIEPGEGTLIGPLGTLICRSPLRRHLLISLVPARRLTREAMPVEEARSVVFFPQIPTAFGEFRKLYDLKLTNSLLRAVHGFRSQFLCVLELL